MTDRKHLWVGSDLFGPNPLTEELGYLYGSVLIDPRWEQVYDALVKMNGDDLNEIVLYQPEKGSILVGGGNLERFIVIYFPAESSHKPTLTLSDSTQKGPDMELTVQTPGEYPAKYCVKLPLVVKVLKFFFDSGNIPTDVRWEIENSDREATFP